jgi:hypothetical protein
LSKEAEKRVKRIREESLNIQEVFVQSPYLGLKDENWKELLGDIPCTILEWFVIFFASGFVMIEGAH